MNRDHYLSKRQQSLLRMPAAYRSEHRGQLHDGIVLAPPAVPDENRSANAESVERSKVRSSR